MIPGWDLPLLSDCKRIGRDTQVSRIQEVIKKANKQVKILDMPSYGMVVIDLSEKVISHDELKDDLPIELNKFKKEVVRALTNNYKSISAALLIWNHIHIMGPSHGGSLIKIVLRTLSEIVKHKKPKYSLGQDLTDIKVGNTLSINIRLSR